MPNPIPFRALPSATAAGVTYRPMRDDEAPLLREFLGLAIFVEDHADPVPPDIVDSPELAKYIDRWGRPDDVAIVAVDGDDVVGAAWARILPAASPGYGHVDDRTPEIDVSVKEEHRGSGIGTALMTRLLDRLAMRGYARASLSVQKANPARRLYERLGFTTVRDGGSDLVMAVPLSGARWILETPRLALREMNAGDLPALRRILQDDETMNAYEGAFDDAMVDGWLARQLARYRDDGFGPWAVVLRATGEVIGQAGLSWQSILDERVLEVGYHFNRDFWHNGYATEAATACVSHAFVRLGASRVWAQVRDTNLASMNVAIRLGMTVRGRFTIRYRGVDMPHLAFAVDAATRN
jgi:RimJ/RimL family protein N-acetyltransferase